MPMGVKFMDENGSNGSFSFSYRSEIKELPGPFLNACENFKDEFFNEKSRPAATFFLVVDERRVSRREGNSTVYYFESSLKEMLDYLIKWLKQKEQTGLSPNNGRIEKATDGGNKILIEIKKF